MYLVEKRLKAVVKGINLVPNKNGKGICFIYDNHKIPILG